ncbi:MAG: hypothetical protein AAGA16_11145 [Cyanobacteria bacterium P01_E01_bin.35]
MGHSKQMIDSDDKKFAFLVLGIPLIGLVYCGLGITAMSYSVIIRQHPITSGAIFILLPFCIAAYTWISASAKAYKK